MRASRNLIGLTIVVAGFFASSEACAQFPNSGYGRNGLQGGIGGYGRSGLQGGIGGYGRSGLQGGTGSYGRSGVQGTIGGFNRSRVQVIIPARTYPSFGRIRVVPIYSSRSSYSGRRYSSRSWYYYRYRR